MAISPLPWTVHCCQFAKESPGSACGLNGESFDSSMDECHHPLSLDEAEFICRCVNSHDKLVGALESCLGVIRKLPQGHSAERVTSELAAREALTLAKEPTP